MRNIKLSDDFLKLLEKYNYNPNTSISEDDKKAILKKYGFKDDDKVSLEDFMDFSQYFGFNKEKYLAFRTLRDDAQVSWEKIANLKYGDIDFVNNTITFEDEISM